MDKNEISVFVCEDPQLTRELIDKHFDTGRLTYAAIFRADQRKAVVNSLDSIQEQ